MKVFNVFAEVFAIFAFLTIGSLLLIISFGILGVEEAVEQLRSMYATSGRLFRTGATGAMFISVGLIFARSLLKKRRQSEALLFKTDIGPVVVSSAAVEDAVKKVLRRFHLVKDWKTKVSFRGKDADIKLRLILWAGGNIQELLTEIQEETRTRVQKLLGAESRLEITCDVQRIEDNEPRSPEFRRDETVPR